MAEEDGSSFAEEPLEDRVPRPLFLTPDHGVLHFEHRQLADAGRDRYRLAEDFDRAFEMASDDPELPALVWDILDSGPSLPMRDDFDYSEPTRLEAIRDARPDHQPGTGEVSPETARDAIQGGWLGACAGCLLGKPVQGWTRDRIHGFLRDSGQWPLSEYIHSDVDPAVAERYDIHTNIEDGHAFIDEVDGMPIDDDIDYIALGLDVLRSHGSDFTTSDVGNEWLESLPAFNTYTAERVAYRNLVNLVEPPETATRRNPYREMIGALIRADPWGFAALGAPATAAELAHRDARLSHVKNGVYGEQWAAAMIAAAPVVESVDALLDAGLGQIPRTSRLAAAVETVRGWHDAGVSVDVAIDRIHDRWNEADMYDWVHTLSNAEVLTLGLCWSEGTFGDALTTAVSAGFDTDSHAATLGAILGAYHGAGALPDRFVDPLDDSVETSLPGRGRESISGLAEETYEAWASATSA